VARFFTTTTKKHQPHHLGNTRITFADLDNSGTVTTTEILQQNHYYPFGANIEGLTTTSPNKYQYNGKEWNADFGLEWNDYGARFYDPWVGRWWGVDAMATKYTSWSSYSFVLNNPALLIDPNGMEITFSADGGYHATGQEAVNAFLGLLQQENKRSKANIEKKDVSVVVTDEVVGTGNVYAIGQIGTDVYFDVNIYRMYVTYYDIVDGEEVIVSREFEALKYGVKYVKGVYQYAVFDRETDIAHPITSLENNYDLGGFDISGPYDFHPQHTKIRDIPTTIGGRTNAGCIGVCGPGSSGWSGVTDMLFSAAGMSQHVGERQTTKKQHLASMLSQINLSITVNAFSLPSGSPIAKEKEKK
jgi:RHS repeat-associated protein